MRDVRGAPAIPPEVHPLLRSSFAAFDSADVAWCVLRGEQEVRRPPGDVDLLISPLGYERARAILAANGFVRLPAHGRGSHSFFLTYDRATDHWLTVDVVTKLSYGPRFSLETHAEEACLRRRRPYGGLFVLHPDDAFWTLLLHCMLDKRQFEPHHAARLKELAPVASPNGWLASLVASVGPSEWPPDRILQSARRGEWGPLKELAPRLAWGWGSAQAWPAARRFFASHLRRLAEKPAVLLHRRGMSVALLGPDGTGKSTLAREVVESFCFPATTVYMGLWQTGEAVTPRPWRLPLRVVLRPVTIWRRYLAGRVHQLLGRLVVFDRYTYDAYLPPRPPLAGAKRLYFWVLAHACPAPDVVLLLDAPGDVVALRKNEDAPEELEWQRRHFLRLRGRLRGLHVLDATCPQTEVKADAVERIWRGYVARWRST